MKNILLLLAVCLGALTPVRGQATFRTVNHAGVDFDCYSIEMDSLSFQAMDFLLNDRREGFDRFVQGMDANGVPFFCMNAGIYANDSLHLGLLVRNGQVLIQPDLGDGQGNFYLKPNGVFGITSQGEAFIQESAEFTRGPIWNGNLPYHATQSGPLLLRRGAVHPAFNPNSANKFVRCGVGINTDPQTGTQFAVFVRSKGPVNLFDFAQVFSEKFGCQDALCLESGGAVMHVSDLDLGGSPHFVSSFIIFYEE